MIGYPLDSHVTYDVDGTPQFDRAISSEPLRKLYKTLFNEGVLPDISTNMQVVTGGGMTVNVLPGFALVNGCQKLTTSEETIILASAHATLPRIDTVVLRLNDNDNVRSCEFAVITGTPASTPVRPSLVREGSIYDIGLADIRVDANKVSINASAITDTRYETGRCGVISSISEFDTTTIYNQVQSDLNYFKEHYEEDISDWTEREKADFLAWYQTIKDILDESVAGKLQNEIDALAEKIENIKLVHLIVTYDEEVVGAKITVTNGTESYEKTADSSGRVVFDGMSLGTWTITENKTGLSAEVVTKYYGNYDVTFGATGFDYKEWLKAGKVSGTYASLEDVLADEKALRQLFTVHASVDYLCSCTDESVNTIINNDYCAKWINLRDYALDSLYAVPEIKAMMDEADKYGYGEWALIDDEWQPKGNVPVMTSNSAPYGEASASAIASGYEAYKAFDGNPNTRWATDGIPTGKIQYKFTHPIIVKRILLQNHPTASYASPKTFSVEASNDRTNWDVLENITNTDSTVGLIQYFNVNNDTPYIFYRLNISSNFSGSKGLGVPQLQFYGRELSVSVPKMTSNTAPFGEVKATSIDPNSYKAFDKDRTTHGIPMATASSSARFMGYKFTKPVSIRQMSIYATDVPLSNCTIQYSNDGITWNDASETFDVAKSKDVVANTNVNVSALYWSIHMGAFSTSTNSWIDELNFYGFDYSEREFAEGSNVKYIYDHGVELDTIIDSYGHSDRENNYLRSHDGSSLATNLLDLSKYNLIRQEMGDEYISDTNNGLGTYTSSVTFWDSYVRYYDASQTFPNGISHDISAITDQKHVAFSAGGSGVMTVKEWWLE